MDKSKSANSLADPALLAKIDKLFELNIGEDVPLPQLLVVGDQSSGKSSVLEGLTNLPFPRNSGLCTRFATQMIFQRSQKQNVEVSIILSASTTNTDHAEKLRAWKKEGLLSLEGDIFSGILEEVSALMGLDGSGPGERKTFSDDVLKIEICGPDQEHLSVIDVPGIFKKTTEGLTTKADIAMVRNMVSSYMKNPRAVILAVIPANIDIAMQEILEMAAESDPEGERTLGVLTKPDLVDKGAEQHVLDLIEGKSHKLSLGWCVVRNRSQKELLEAFSDRHEVERTFFKTENPWTNIEKDRVGIEALRTRLTNILAEVVRREFSLRPLGPARETKEQQHKFILELATRFQMITSLALAADYGADQIFETSGDLKLATAIVTCNEKFAVDINEWGHTVDFNPNPTPTTSSPTESKLEYAHSLIDHDIPGIEDLLPSDIKIKKPGSQDIMPWLEDIYKTSRGFELGTFNTTLLPLIWRKQSANWEKLALVYISRVIIIVHGYTLALLGGICGDERVLRGITSVLTEEWHSRYRKAIDQVKFVLYVERACTPMTTNHCFNENLEKSRHERQRARWEGEKVCSHHKGVEVVTVNDLQQENAQISNAEHAVQDIHDILKAYYKVARKRFVDVVCMQGADYHLVTGPDTPAKVFSPSFASELTPDQLEMIAGESFDNA